MRRPPVEKALERRKARREEWRGRRFVRFSDDYRRVPRGTVVFEEDGAVVYGYPRIGRVLSLERGLAEQLRPPVWAEEKIDGFNVRVLRRGGELLALSRGGFVCPFTTDRLPDLLDLSVFDDEPELVLCAEVAGPGNPYNTGSPPFVREDVRLFVFDLMRRGSPRYLPQREKLALYERYALPAAQVFGRYGAEDLGALREILRRLDAEGREGLVLKEAGRRARRAKYVTGRASLNDVGNAARSLLDLPAEFFTDRVLRLALYLAEMDRRPDAALEHDLGAAFLDELGSAVEQFRREHRVTHAFRCRFRARESAEALVAQLERAQGSEFRLQVRRLEKEEGYFVLEFERSFPRMNGTLGHLLGGGLLFD